MAKGVLNRRQFSLSAAVAASAWAIPSVSTEIRLEKNKVTLAVSGKASFYYLPLTIAEQLGYFEQEGIELEIIEFQSVLKAQQALTMGSADVVCGAFDHVINLHSKNQIVQSFVALGRTPQMAMGVSVKNLPNYKEVIDLKGKKIGITAPGTASNLMASLLLQRAGLLSSEVSFIGVGTAAGAIAAIRSGQIDAVCNLEPVMTMLEQKGDIKIISDARTLKGTQALYGGLMPAACLYAPLDSVHKSRLVTQALTNAIVRALKWLQTAGPRDLMKAVPEAYLLGDRGLYLASYNNLRESISLDGMIADEEAKTALRVLSNFESTMKADKIELPKTFTNVFVRRAKAQFRV
ncbi:MAG: MetQ/NlpA family ABC transporter substrate-binding protein [Cellvibrio sp.]|uniref:MetQ/NlpA family ABC transporter substrate-binding protein n=1 Tax=Cellvibrio sp. TaxID=1965322 RepID=UPI002716C345|nr:MetQ/NlpA family ABC transporter substrate-binding protein [Cellvibrio sp.]